jgi:opacity protein-like surface antigen
VSIQSGIAFGGNLGVRMPMGIAIEGQVGYAPAEIEFDDGTGGTQTEDLKVLFAAANLQWRFGPPLIPVKPYVTGGAGIVRWQSDAFTAFGAEESVTNLAGNLGAGAYISVGPVMKLRLDGRAYITTFSAQDFDPTTADESKFQSHFVATAGLAFELGN